MKTYILCDHNEDKLLLNVKKIKRSTHGFYISHYSKCIKDICSQSSELKCVSNRQSINLSHEIRPIGFN